MTVLPILVSMAIVQMRLVGTLVSVIPCGRAQTVTPASFQTVHDATAMLILRHVKSAMQDLNCHSVCQFALQILVRMVAHALYRDQMALSVHAPGVGLVTHAQGVLKDLGC